MANTKIQVLGAVVAGFGAGFATGYYLPYISGGPKITVVGTTWTYSGFPANVPLMSVGGGTGGIGSAPINLGQTNANGTLVISGVPPVPAGNTVLYIAFVATEPSIYATTILKT